MLPGAWLYSLFALDPSPIITADCWPRWNCWKFVQRGVVMNRPKFASLMLAAFVFTLVVLPLYGQNGQPAPKPQDPKQEVKKDPPATGVIKGELKSPHTRLKLPRVRRNISKWTPRTFVPSRQ